MVRGTPWRGPSGAPRAAKDSAAPACLRTLSGSRWTKAFNLGCSASMRLRWSSTISRGGIVLVCSILVCFAALLARSSATPTQEKAASAKKSGASSGIADAYRFNALGVAYMNQQRPADAQKHFEQALESDAKFAVARLNMGICLLAQQKLESARTALEKAARQLPKDAFAWYNLGLAHNDLGESEKGIAGFDHVTEIAPNEADAYYFVGHLYSQLQ